MLYRLEQRIHTLAQNVVDRAKTTATGFTVEEVSFSSWQCEPDDDWGTHPYWLSAADIDANGYREAWQLFWNRLARIVPRISLVSQCYAEYFAQPMLILRKNSSVAFLNHHQRMRMCDSERHRDRLGSGCFWHFSTARSQRRGVAVVSMVPQHDVPRA